MSDNMSRRQFLGAAAASGMALSGPWTAGVLGAAGSGPAPASTSFAPIRIRKVYLAKPVPTWPKPDLDIPATRLDGPGKPAAPYIIRSHMEDNKGASLQVKMRVGQPITCAKLSGLDTMLVSTAKIVDNPDVDRGCRTKITTQVPNARKLLEGYSGGLHRVIFYGDLLAGVKNLAFLQGWKVVEEV